jgi:hypothetical protein
MGALGQHDRAVYAIALIYLVILEFNILTC